MNEGFTYKSTILLYGFGDQELRYLEKTVAEECGCGFSILATDDNIDIYATPYFLAIINVKAMSPDAYKDIIESLKAMHGDDYLSPVIHFCCSAYDFPDDVYLRLLINDAFNKIEVQA